MHKVGQKPDRSTEVKFCTRCVISNQRPRMVFDKEGVCGACLYSDKKKTIDWKKREEELVELCNKHRKMTGHLMLSFQQAEEKIAVMLRTN